MRQKGKAEARKLPPAPTVLSKSYPVAWLCVIRRATLSQRIGRNRYATLKAKGYLSWAT